MNVKFSLNCQVSDETFHLSVYDTIELTQLEILEKFCSIAKSTFSFAVTFSATLSVISRNDGERQKSWYVIGKIIQAGCNSGLARSSDLRARWLDYKLASITRIISVMRAGPSWRATEPFSWSYYLQDSKLLRVLAEFQPKLIERADRPPVKFCCFPNEETLLSFNLHRVWKFHTVRMYIHFTYKGIMFLHIPEGEDSKRLEIKQQRYFTELFNEVFSVCTEISYFVKTSRRAGRSWNCKTSNRLRDSVCILQGMYSVVKFERSLNSANIVKLVNYRRQP